jgi:hypothetical protein
MAQKKARLRRSLIQIVWFEFDSTNSSDELQCPDSFRIDEQPREPLFGCY